MTLPIVESMLRGDLRRNILPTLKTEKEIATIRRQLSNVVNSSDLISIEHTLVKVLEKEGLIQLSPVFQKERELRRSAESARKQGLTFGPTNYTCIDEMADFSEIFDSHIYNSPIDRLYTLLLQVEAFRAKLALKYMSISLQDDVVMRTEVRKLLQKIVQLCKEANEVEIQESLTILYFDIIYSFKMLLSKGEIQNQETDFEEFVYAWKGEYPDSIIVERYKKMEASFIVLPKPKENVSGRNVPTTHSKEDDVKKDKVDIFLEAANAFTFSSMPMVKELDSKKIRQLVECLLADKGSHYDTYGHTAAMLNYLGFYDWIKKNHVSGYSLTQFDTWCSQNIMGIKGSSSFKHYRLSVNVDPKDSQNASHKYKGWLYKDTVNKEYEFILNS